MLDIKYIRENADAIKTGAKAKRIKVDLDTLLKLDGELKPKQAQWEELQAERNKLSKEIGKTPPDQRQAKIEQVNQIKAQMEGLTEELRELREQFDAEMLLVPQPARDDVPVGKDDTDNVEVKTWGQPPQFDFKPKDHVDLGESLGLFDVERGVKLAGSRSYVLTGMGARLEQAVMRFTYDMLVKRNYTPLQVPVLVTEEAMVGTGYFPVGREQAYCVEKDGLALVGTSEVSLTSFHSGEMLKAGDLPKRYMAQSSCFRREAGT